MSGLILFTRRRAHSDVFSPDKAGYGKPRIFDSRNERELRRFSTRTSIGFINARPLCRQFWEARYGI